MQAEVLLALEHAESEVDDREAVSQARAGPCRLIIRRGDLRPCHQYRPCPRCYHRRSLAWVHRGLLLAHLRLSAMQQREVSYEVLADLSARELVELLLLEYPDAVDDPLVRGLRDEFGGMVGEG